MKASAGGLLRNYDGLWFRGFLFHIGATSSIQAALWGVREGLKLASDLIVQVDASLVVDLLNMGGDLTGLNYLQRISLCYLLR